MKHRPFECYAWKSGLWFRFLGYGLHFKPSSDHQKLFSERYCYTKAFYVGPVRIEVLKPVWI